MNRVVEVAPNWRLPPYGRPPDKCEAPARDDSAGADNCDTGTGPAKYNEGRWTLQEPPGGAAGCVAFTEIVRKSTPPELLEMARLHRLYMPTERLPSVLQQAIGAAWRST